VSSHDGPGTGGEPLSFDVTVAHPARVYDYWLGGKDNYEADREAAEQVIAANPGVLPGVRANRAFLRRAVEHLVHDGGVRQFLDIGTGLPTADNTHEVAQGLAPDARIVYVDNDPIVLAHARALLTSTPAGATAYVHADAREPGKILAEAAGVLDFSKPVAVMALMVLQYIPDADDPHQIVHTIMEPLPPGSYLVISDTTRDINTEQVAESAARLNQRMGGTRQTRRSREEIAAFFDGLSLIDPGLVPLPQWRAGEAAAPGVAAYAGVARKP
jgi:S-adenosyl methyltransferase